MTHYRPLSRRLDRCDRMIQNESRDPNGGNVYYVTIQIMFLTRKFRNVERNLHCGVVHFTTVWDASLTRECNGVFAIKAYSQSPEFVSKMLGRRSLAAGIGCMGEQERAGVTLKSALFVLHIIATYCVNEKHTYYTH